MSDDADHLTGAEPDAPKTMRDDMVQNAVAFLQHPQVRARRQRPSRRDERWRNRTVSSSPTPSTPSSRPTHSAV